LIQISVSGRPIVPYGQIMAAHLKRDIIVILSIKLSIVLIAAVFVFGPTQRPRIDSETIDRQILGDAGQAPLRSTRQ